MKAERINKNQIRFTLNADDLSQRNIRISELSYGSDKAKTLFHDMMTRAQQEFGFDFSAQPIMIEAVPLSQGSIMITVTKVHKPENGEPMIPAITTPLSSVRREAGSASDSEQTAEPAQAKADLPQEGYFLFGFTDFRTLCETAALVPDKLHLKNCLYLDPKSQRYYIEAQYRQNGPKIRYTLNLLYEYASEIHSNPMSGLFLKEHAKCLMNTRALQKLKMLA